MASNADLTLTAAVDSFFLLPDVETIVYRPRSGSSRSISAVVTRLGPQKIGPLAGGSREQVEILVRNDATSGIASSEVDTGGDKVDVALRHADSSITLRVVEIIKHDAAMLNLRCY